jgi:hypothetical protein
MRLRNTRARMCMTTTSPTTSSNWGLSRAQKESPFSRKVRHPKLTLNTKH